VDSHQLPSVSLNRFSEYTVSSFSSHRQRLFDLLGLKGEPTVDDLKEAISKVESVPFETLATEKGCVCSAIRTFKEWDESPQGVACRDNYDRDGPVRVVRDGEASGRAAWSKKPGHLAEGVKVVDMTRVVAGPVGGRVMACEFCCLPLLTHADSTIALSTRS
jgi:hypothetical protein